MKHMRTLLALPISNLNLLYYKIKLRENKVRAPASMISREMMKVEELYKKLDFDQALEYINNRIKKQMIWF